MKRPLTLISGLVLLVMLAVGTQLAVKCSEEPTPPSWSSVPEGFVNQPSGHFPFRAVAPDGTVIAVRERANEAKGDLDYWTEVFRLEMTEGKGYKLVETADVKSSDGVAGKLMRFEVAQDEIPFAYQLALYVTEKTIISVEAGVELARIDHYGAAFDTVRKDLDTRASFYHREE